MLLKKAIKLENLISKVNFSFYITHWIEYSYDLENTQIS